MYSKIICSLLDTGLQSKDLFYHSVYLAYSEVPNPKMYNPLE
jgi:hypothetical protein